MLYSLYFSCIGSDIFLVCTMYLSHKRQEHLNSQPFLKLTCTSERTQSVSIIKNHHITVRSSWCEMCYFYVILNQNQNLSTYFLFKSWIWNFREICPVGLTLFHADRQTDRHNETTNTYVLCYGAYNDELSTTRLQNYIPAELVFSTEICLILITNSTVSPENTDALLQTQSTYNLLQKRYLPQYCS
jgi:hypothetical protein